MSTAIITQGIGPSGSIKHFLTLGLDFPAAATAPNWRTYSAKDEGNQYAAKGAGRQHAAKDAGRTYSADRQG